MEIVRFISNLGKLLLPESSKNLTFILKHSPTIQYSTRGRVTQPPSINFTIRLRLDLGHRLCCVGLFFTWWLHITRFFMIRFISR